jgi:hypothetical protein
MENEMNGLTKPRDFGDGCPLTNERYVWSCAIGGLKPVPVPSGGDAPMRRAVERAFLELTGHEAQACFSGWGEEFAEPARAVIENRIPVEEEKSVRADIQSAELATALDQLAAAKAEVERLRYQINEASDPDFLFGAMDNVNDMDVSLDDFARAASRAIRAALALTPGKRYLDGHGEVKGPLHRIHWENGEEMLTDSYVVWHPDGTLAGGTREDKRSLVAEVGDAG